MSKRIAKARVLLYDIETAPNLSYTWGKWQQDVIDFHYQSYMLCFAYKWLGESQTHIVALPDFPNYKKDVQDDSALIEALQRLFDEADVIIAHNGNSFDQKVSQGRMLVNGLTPPSPYKQIDTKLVAKRYFRFNSNSLNDLGQLLKLGKKLPTGGWKLWLGCLNNDAKSWATMKRYNIQDVKLLEKVYLRMRPWIDNHPAMNILEDKLEACPKCSSGPLIKRGTRLVNKTTTVQRFKCSNCGGWSRGRKSERAENIFVN
jgi:hypothetical protein